MVEYVFCNLLLLLLSLVMVHGDCPLYQEHEKECHPCSRECIEGESMTCYYPFKIEVYYSMSKACYDCPANITDCFRKHCVSVDGYSKVLYTANRQIPGPTLEVCEGDKIEVTLENCMNDETTSVHWHGFLQEGTPYMDGVPYVTQCPINPGTKFEVKFVAKDVGTHFWHGHTGVQRCDGLYGPLIVRQPKNKTIYADMYDYDRIVLAINDWSHSSGADKLMMYLHKGGDNDADTFLCNGRGRYYNDSTQVTYTPLFPINVVQGKRYRIRIIHAGCYDCPFQMYIDNHTMLAIACDGHEIQPVKCDALVMSPGERWDVILEANQSEGNYWIRITGLMNCANTLVHTVIPIHYEGASCEEPNTTVGYDIHPTAVMEVNTLNVGKNTSGSVTIPELKAYSEHPKNDKKVLKEKADQQIWLAYDFSTVNNPMMHVENLYGFYEVNSSMQCYTPQMNNISMLMTNQPLLSQYCSLDRSKFCEDNLSNNNNSEYYECTIVRKVKLNSIVEIIIIDEGEILVANHPFHLHGFSFRVVGMDLCNYTCSMKALMELDKAGKLLRNLDNDPPAKDTIHVPTAGYTMVRFRAKNPGYWMFHCHFDIHFHLKMAIVIKVGDHEDFPPIPYKFPRCGDFNNDNTRCLKRYY